jgi:aldehyde:ferredoxin oxidoreductase
MDITGGDVVGIGKEILRMERLFNERAGFTSEHDRPPEFMRYEPVAPHGEVWTVTDEELDHVFSWVHEN